MIENKLKEVQEDIALAIIKSAVFLDPKIVKKCVEYNNKQKTKLESILPKSIHKVFLYDNSDCIFPGVRRHINKETNVSRWKNNVCDKDRMIVNDNTYPRNIWTYLLSGRSYSGGKNGSWSKEGLSGFELAHLFAHKKDEIKNQTNQYININSEMNPSPLFTSASNIILVPKGVSKPTDKLPFLQGLLFARVMDIYGEFVDYPNIVKKEISKDIKSFYTSNQNVWNDFFEPVNWESNLEKLFEYRLKHLKMKYENIIC